MSVMKKITKVPLFPAACFLIPVCLQAQVLTISGSFAPTQSALNTAHVFVGNFTARALAAETDWQMAMYNRITPGASFTFTVQWDPEDTTRFTLDTRTYQPATLLNAVFPVAGNNLDFSEYTAAVNVFGDNNQYFNVLIERREILWAERGRYLASSIYLISDAVSDRIEFRRHGNTHYGLGAVGVRGEDMEYVFGAIPEPATCGALLGLFVLGGAIYRRRR